MTFDPKTVRLGKHPRRNDPRTLRLSDYLSPPDVASPPAEFHIFGGVSNWGMFYNDKAGDCTCASRGHAIQAWTSAASSEVTLSDNDILKAYADITGYDWKTGANDNGANMLDVLNYARQTGIGGRKILGYSAANEKNIYEVKMALSLLGGVYCGVQLPESAQNQTSVWDCVADTPNGPNVQPGSWGGHAITVIGYDAAGVTLVTWGQTMRMTWNFFLTYVDECYGVASLDWVTRSGLTPSGLNLDQMMRDIEAVAAMRRA